MILTVRDKKGLASINTLRPRQNGRHFTDDIFKCIFLNENGGWGWGFSKVMDILNHVGGSFNLFMATTGDV